VVSVKLSAAPRWAAGLPVEAVVARGEVPELPRGRSMTFEARGRAVTMARLYGRCGWTLKRIGNHFGVGLERVRQLVLSRWLRVGWGLEKPPPWRSATPREGSGAV
jgi:hypothetical protein